MYHHSQLRYKKLGSVPDSDFEQGKLSNDFTRKVARNSTFGAKMDFQRTPKTCQMETEIVSDENSNNNYLVFRSNATSLRKACICSGLGFRTFKVLTATGPYQ